MHLSFSLQVTVLHPVQKHRTNHLHHTTPDPLALITLEAVLSPLSVSLYWLSASSQTLGTGVITHLYSLFQMTKIFSVILQSMQSSRLLEQWKMLVHPFKLLGCYAYIIKYSIM
jgi:hypothetical protein